MTPNDEHEGGGDAIHQQRRDGQGAARRGRIAYRRNHTERPHEHDQTLAGYFPRRTADELRRTPPTSVGAVDSTISRDRTPQCPGLDGVGPVAQVAADLGISNQTIYAWRKQELIDSGQLPGLNRAQLAELSVARKRIRESEHEVAILKRPVSCCGSPTTLWSPSNFAASCRGAPLSIIRQYIEGQARLLQNAGPRPAKSEACTQENSGPPVGPNRLRFRPLPSVCV